ncbi:MAG: pyruvate decarboxylase [Alphaproteobacteria bacterium]|nr:pyruvate decarboxylase [Alphaproteobacteria bacterium]
MSDSSTVGGYLASRLQDIGLRQYFAVPGDYNLVLLDELLKNKNLQMISCCNELNAGYAADGYSRATGGPAAAVVTYSVGGLSLLNAVAGAYAEDIPVIAISGGPNTNSEAEYEYLHHTLGEVDYSYQRDLFSRVTVESVVLHHPMLAPAQIDNAIEMALSRRKPVYIEVASNIAGASTSAPSSRGFGEPSASDPRSLKTAVEHAAKFLNAAEKPVLVAGSRIRAGQAEASFRALADTSGYAVASMPNAKSFVSEHQENYMGIYWGPVSSTGCSEVVEASDAALFAGPIFTDYTTTGHQLGVNRKNMVVVAPNSVLLQGALYSQVRMDDFLSKLAPKLNKSDGAMVAFDRIREDVPELEPTGGEAPLTVRQLFARVQKMLDGDSTLLVETGDSWFNGMDIKLPADARFEIQMQYGSIGWSVGATLGYALGKSKGRLISCIGDGSFQMTAQELSTMIRYGVNPIIFLINNGGYTIEVEIHDGPYNTIKNWRYADLVDVFGAGEGNGWSGRASTEGELDDAIAKALGHDGLCLIEVMIDRDDCNRNLLRWGNRVAQNNGRPPRCE